MPALCFVYLSSEAGKKYSTNFSPGLLDTFSFSYKPLTDTFKITLIQALLYDQHSILIHLPRNKILDFDNISQYGNSKEILI